MSTIREATRHLVPLFQRQEERPSVCGTATFIAVAQMRFLVTAAHVLDEDDAIHFGHGIIVDPATTQVTSTSVPASGLRADDRLDIALLQLSSEYADRLVAQRRQPIQLADWDVDELARARQSYVFSGYPASRAEFDRRRRLVDLGPMSASCLSEPESVIRAVGADPRTHIVGRFDRRRMMDEQGRQVTAPGPWGMSGGPVWTHRRGSDQLVLVGIGIEYHESRRVLIGTRLGAVVALLRASFPATLPHLAEPRFFTVGGGETTA